MSIRELQDEVSRFLSKRPTMLENNSHPGKVAELLQSEVDEALAVLDQPDKLGHELADILFFCFTIANSHGLDLDTAFKEKVQRNEAKYSPEYFQDGDYEENWLRARREWAEAGGDDAFFQYFNPNPLSLTD